MPKEINQSFVRPALKKACVPDTTSLPVPFSLIYKPKLRLPEINYMVHTSQRASRARPSTNTERAITVSVVPLEGRNKLQSALRHMRRTEVLGDANRHSWIVRHRSRRIPLPG
jgi:hypothetical protein